MKAAKLAVFFIFNQIKALKKINFERAKSVKLLLINKDVVTKLV